MRTGFEEPQRDAAADALGPSGDHHDPAGEVEVIGDRIGHG
jgi:hypothetical protein